MGGVGGDQDEGQARINEFESDGHLALMWISISHRHTTDQLISDTLYCPYLQVDDGCLYCCKGLLEPLKREGLCGQVERVPLE